MSVRFYLSYDTKKYFEIAFILGENAKILSYVFDVFIVVIL